MANTKSSKGAGATERHRRGGTIFLALTFAAVTSFAATTSVTALNGESGLNTSTDSSASVDGSVGTNSSESSADAGAEAETGNESGVSLSNGGAEVSNSVEANTGSGASVSLNESEDSEDDNSESGSETDTEASGEASITSSVAAPGNGNGDEVGFGMQLLLSSNILSMLSEPAELDEGDVKAQAASESEANFESDFTYYEVSHGLDYEEAIYREPARLGGDNVELSGSSTGSFWFGVSGPDEDGVQSEINHQGKTLLYLKTDEGWKSLEAQFNGEGELQHVNGVSPEAMDEETEGVVE